MGESDRANAALYRGDRLPGRFFINESCNPARSSWQPAQSLSFAPALEYLEVIPVTTKSAVGVSSRAASEDLIEFQFNVHVISITSYLLARQMIAACQIRSARALLNWSADDLANYAGVGWATIQRFESSEGIPPSRSGTLAKVKKALETAGIEFIGDPVTSPGVRLHRP